MQPTREEPPATRPTIDAATPPPVPSLSGQRLGVVDAVMFFVGFFAVVALSVRFPFIPAKAALLPGVAMVGLRHWLAPPKPREPRAHTAIVGVLGGLLVVAGVVLLGFAGMGLTRYASGHEPDWNARLEAELATERASERALGIGQNVDPAEREARIRQNAAFSVDPERHEWTRRHDDEREISLKLLAAGAAALGLATVLERLRTKPVA